MPDNLTQGFYTFEFIWFDLVSKSREMIKDYTDGIFDKMTDNNISIKNLKEKLAD